MIKKIELIGERYHLGSYEEHETVINNRIVRTIDTSCFVSDRRISLYDENRRIISELYIPQTILVKVSYT